MPDKSSIQTKHRLVITAAGLLLAVGLFISIFLPMRQRAELMRSLKDKSVVIGNMIAYSSEAGLKFSDSSAIEEALNSLKRIEEVETAVVYDAKGNRFASYRPEKAALIPEARLGGTSSPDATQWFETEGMLFLRVPINSGSSVLGSIVLGISQRTLLSNIAVIQYMTIGLTITIALLGGYILWVLSSRIVGPVRRLQQVAERVAIGDLNASVDTLAQDEIMGALSESFRSLMKYLRSVAAGAEALGRGDLTQKLAARSDQDLLSHNFIRATETLGSLASDIKTLIAAARMGRLGTRGDTAKYQGVYREIVQGINEMLDAAVSPIDEAATVLERVAARDLTVLVQGNYQGDYAKIKTALNTAISNLKEALSQVSHGAEQVASAAEQISSGSQSLSRNASSGAAALEKVLSNLQGLSTTSKQNATSAREASSLAEAARLSTDQGVASMQRMTESMQRINSSADATAKIVKTIDEIAFQTNLLALNAAVEAARAGDAGKGFAVVAEEVRNLAIRSAEAAKNTTVLIEDSVKNSSEGAVTNREVIAKLDEISAQIRRVSQVMGDIVTASEQQEKGVGQIGQAVDQIMQATQQTAASAEESASASEELTGQSADMRGMVRSFTLDAGGHPSGAPASSTRSRVRQLSPKSGAAPVAKPNGGLRPAGMIPLLAGEEREPFEGF